MTSHYPLVPILQADSVLSQANPVSGTQYSVLASTPNTRIIDITCSVTWTVQPTPLEIHGQIDGITYIFAQGNPASTSVYIPWIAPGNPANGHWMLLRGGVGYQDQVRTFLLEARSIAFQAETTGGTTSNLSARVHYEKW